MTNIKKHILIDARLYGTKHTGIGRYTQNLLKAMIADPDSSKYDFSFLVYAKQYPEIKKDFPQGVKLIPTNIKHYSISEQVLLPLVLFKEAPDLVHFTHFNKPILYSGKSVVTIHDLIKHFFKGKDTTTRSPLLYWPKYWSYLLISQIVIKTSSLIVPSNYWKDYLIKNFHLKKNQVTTTYEAVDPGFMKSSSKPVSKPENYVLYTGNLYPHKNVATLIEAIKLTKNIGLKIICARSVFSQRLEQLARKNQLENRVEFLGYVNDKEFSRLYRHAIALVHPSLMEGFSLTGLEAMALSCPVIAANASCLPEIYQDAAVYFKPTDYKDLAAKILKLSKSSVLRNKLIILGKKQVSKFSWSKTAKETLSVYKKLLDQ